MSGNAKGKKAKQFAGKVWAIVQKGIDDAQGVILANRQTFEEKIVISNLEEALGSIRAAIEMPVQGFESAQEANLWLRGFFVPEDVRAERMRGAGWWTHFIQTELGLTDNYQSAIRTYLFTGKIGSIEANAVVEVDLIKNDVRVIPRDHIRDAEKPFLQEFSEALLARVGQTVKKFTLTNHRARDPEKHAKAIAILRRYKQKTKMKLTDMEIVMKEISPADSVQLTDAEKKRLSAMKNTRYDKLKRRRS